MQTWQIQTAKARFSELVKQAAEDGPQEITLHGKPVAVVLSILSTMVRMAPSDSRRLSE